MASRGRFFLGKLGLVVVAAAVLAAMVMLLWNAVVPAVFAGGRSIDYPHAVGMLVLCRILFGRFGGPGGGRHGHRRWGRWQAMTPEERQQFKQNMPSDRQPGEGN